MTTVVTQPWQLSIRAGARCERNSGRFDRKSGWHMSRLRVMHMSAGARLVLFLCLLFLLVLSGPRVGEAPISESGPLEARSAAPAPDSPLSDPPAVRLEHELVYPPIVSTHRAPAARPLPFRHAAASRPREQVKFAERARRVLFGDGSHRPEPFPRPTRD